MEKWNWKTRHAKVEPDVPSSSSLNGSMLLQSISSLTPSQLDQTIMEVLNIKADGTMLDKCCEVNPISSQGKRLQMVRLMGIIMVPIASLLLLMSYIFGSTLHEHLSMISNQKNIRFSLEISRMLHMLQRERDRSALYVSAIGPDTKDFLIKTYRITDEAIDQMSRWPREINKTSVLKTRDRFKAYLNIHRYTLDVDIPTIIVELNFYTEMMDTIMAWLFEAITYAPKGEYWKYLMSLQELVQTRVALGTERALGTVFFVKGGFESIRTYLEYVRAQEVADLTLYSAQGFSAVFRVYYNMTVDAMPNEMILLRQMRKDIRNSRLTKFEPSLAVADQWFENMTEYLDALYTLQVNISGVIDGLLDKKRSNGENYVLTLGVMFAIIVIACPVFVNVMYTISSDLQMYSATLADRTRALNKEKKRTDSLLYQMLPRMVADRLKKNQTVKAENFTMATIMFSDIVGFTSISAQSSPLQVIEMLNSLYTAFDKQLELFDVYKVETIGDAYMVASGLPNRNGNRHVAEISTLALALQDFVSDLEVPHIPGRAIQIRIGFHSGPVVAGIVGLKMPRYCLFGETVSLAAQLESTGKPERIHVSSDSEVLLKKLEGFVTKKRIDPPSELAPTFWLLFREGMEQKRARSPLPGTSGKPDSEKDEVDEEMERRLAKSMADSRKSDLKKESSLTRGKDTVCSNASKGGNIKRSLQSKGLSTADSGVDTEAEEYQPRSSIYPLQE